MSTLKEVLEHIEKEFDKEFPHKQDSGGFEWLGDDGKETGYPMPSWIKSFIRQAVISACKTVARECEVSYKMIDKNINAHQKRYPTGYNTALAATKEKQELFFNGL